jgi:ATP-dependent DNA helicase DinG
MLSRAAHVQRGSRVPAVQEKNEVVYIDNDVRGCSINIAPIDIASLLAVQYKEPSNTTVYVSATLAINGTLDIFKQRVGVHLADNPRLLESMFGTAFDLDKQALLYLSKVVPIPTREDATVGTYRSRLVEEIYDLVSANNGNAFVLFTARDEMDFVTNELKSRSSLPILEQEAGRSAADLLKRFRATDNAVLLGLKSFWEGVDVAGDKLSLVIITKLPFPGRSDPIISARRERAGDSWFAYVDIPDMTLDLRQGVGRLIRSATDRGVIAILDQRVLSKPYGKGVLRSIGLKQVTTNKDAVLRALGNLASKRGTI